MVETIERMSSVVQLIRHLDRRPKLPRTARVALRNYLGPLDIAHWLAIRDASFAREKPGVRSWGCEDFERDFLAKSWWSPQRMWLAVPSAQGQEDATPVGTVTMAMRGSGKTTMPVVHWLAVVPGWRRRGVARLLMAALETECWEAGFRRVGLETHKDWTRALMLYESLGYRLASESHRNE